MAAPNPWNNNVSLKYWVFDNSKPFTRIMSDQIGRGTAIRDISDPSLPKLLRYGLDWQYYILTGIGNVTYVNTEGNTSNLIPYKSGISRNTIEEPTSIKRVTKFSEKSTFNSSIGENIAWMDPTVISHLGKPEEKRGTSFSILKKDGTWDIVFFDSNPNISTISYEDMELHCADNEYARTVDGHLRCRFTKLSQTSSGYYGTSDMDVHFYVMEDIPQKPAIMYNGPVTSRLRESTKALSPYERLVRISYKDVEGIDKLLLKRRDIGSLSTVYEEIDCKKGFTDLVVDIDYDTEVTLVASNKFGSTPSETIIIETLNLVDIYSIKQENDNLLISKDYERDFSHANVSYSITALDANVAKGLIGSLITDGLMPEEGMQLNICDLKSGIYILKITDPRGHVQEFKFSK